MRAIRIQLLKCVDGNGPRKGIELVTLHRIVPANDGLAILLVPHQNGLQSVRALGSWADVRQMNLRVTPSPLRHGFWNATERQVLLARREGGGPGEANQQHLRKRRLDRQPCLLRLVARGTLRLERQQRLPHELREAALHALRPQDRLRHGRGLQRQGGELLRDEGVVEGALEGNPDGALVLHRRFRRAVAVEGLEVRESAWRNEGVVEGRGVVDGAGAAHVVDNRGGRGGEAVHVVVQVH